MCYLLIDTIRCDGFKAYSEPLTRVKTDQNWYDYSSQFKLVRI